MLIETATNPATSAAAIPPAMVTADFFVTSTSFRVVHLGRHDRTGEVMKGGPEGPKESGKPAPFAGQVSVYGGIVRTMRLVLVEDEDAIVRPLLAALGREGFVVDRYVTAEEALAAMADSRPDAVIVDISLPGMSGIDACRVVKQRWGLPVIMLTARSEVEDKVMALELGADDYVTKPFGSRELVARIRSVLRRFGWQESPHTLVRGELEVDCARHQVLVAGRRVSLRPKEFELLSYLMERSPGVVRREELMRRVWDAHWFGSTATLDVHIGQLRRKIEPDPGRPRYIHTVRGIGYRVLDACAGA
jgi:DNA-binding response OmpR family regulator